MFRGLLTIEYEKKIEQNINFIAEFFTMKGFYSDTYKISLITPNEKKIYFAIWIFYVISGFKFYFTGAIFKFWGLMG